MSGLWFRLLEIDLDRQSSYEREFPRTWGEVHLGGRGVGARYLLEDRRRRGSPPDPLSGENPLLFVTGPLQGIAVPGAGKHIVMSWSPRTGGLNESYAGGALGYELARSGVDGVVLRGRSPAPCYVLFEQGRLQFLDARDLWGLTTDECERRLRERHGSTVAVATIGSAGERLVRMSCIVHDGGHAAGRPGFGAVMGSKRVKAIVVKGSDARPIADRMGLRRAARAYTELTLSNPGIRGFMDSGTSAGVSYYNELGILPTRNFRQGVFGGAANISTDAINSRLLVRRDACRGCAVRCRPILRVGDREMEGPEYETLASFGSLCLVDDLEVVAGAHHLCNQHGLDAISVGVSIAWLMEASEHGLVAPRDRLDWGDGSGLLRMVDEIVHRRGIGDALADGVAAAAQRYGGGDFAVEIRGIELPMHDPRGKKGLAISYATSPRGATHLEAMHDEMFEGVDAPTPEIGVLVPLDRLSWDGKPDACKRYEDLYSFVNSCVVCGFVSWNRAASGAFYPFPLIRDVLRALTGRDLDATEMMRIGERNYLLRRVIAAMDGQRRESDNLPLRLKEALPDGPSAGERIDDRRLQEAIDAYYELRGMDDYGPTDERLRHLGLADLAGLIPR